MNLFLPSPIIEDSIKSLDDKRVVKMCLETAQILSTAVRVLDPDTTLPVYKLTHKNHPVSVWVRNNTENYNYSLRYLIAITDEYTFRFDKTHACSKLVPYFVEFYKQWVNSINRVYYLQLEPFVNCTDYKELEVHEAYKKCLTNKWKHDKIKPKWTNRTVPSWKE